MANFFIARIDYPITHAQPNMLCRMRADTPHHCHIAHWARPQRSTKLRIKILLNPKKAILPPLTDLGVVGAMISGAPLFNPSEFDQAIVAMQSNLSVKNTAGVDVWFLDDCAGYPTPFGEYHYHALPKYIITKIDRPSGPSYILGIALDGSPFYSDHDINGKKITTTQLDKCNGIHSPTPEFPNGVYHYVLLDMPDATSSIRCFTRIIEPSLIQMPGMPGMPPKK